MPGRADPADAYVGEARSLDEVPEGARIGTASLRRRSQLLALRPDLELGGAARQRRYPLAEAVRGRVRRGRARPAGLRRLGREAEVAFSFGLAELTPAAGQGSLALEARREDSTAAQQAAGISDHDALVELTAERAAVAALDATCYTPVGIAPASRPESWRCSDSAGLPTAPSGCATGSRAIPSSPRRSAGRWPSGCSRRAR